MDDMAHAPRANRTGAEQTDRLPRERLPYSILIWLALASFTTGIDGYVLAGLLPQISGSLRVSESIGGQLLSVFALTSAICGPVLGALTGGWERRRTLTIALAVFVAGNLIVAAAPDYAIAVIGRMVSAVGASVLVAGVSGVVVHVVPASLRARALSFVLGGWMAATALGVPLGLLLGQVSWRFPLIMVAMVGVVALLGVAHRLPTLRLPALTLRQRLRPLLDVRLAVALLVSTGILCASYTTFTYAAVILAPTHRAPWMIIVIMFGYGLASMLGNALTGRLADRFGAVRVLTIWLSGLLLIALPGPYAVAGPVISLCWFFAAGIGNGGSAVPQQARLVALAPQSATVILALNASAISLGVALGGVIGGAALSRWGAPHLLWVAAAILAATVIIHLISVLLSRRSATRCG